METPKKKIIKTSKKVEPVVVPVVVPEVIQDAQKETPKEKPKAVKRVKKTENKVIQKEEEVETPVETPVEKPVEIESNNLNAHESLQSLMENMNPFNQEMFEKKMQEMEKKMNDDFNKLMEEDELNRQNKLKKKEIETKTIDETNVTSTIEEIVRELFQSKEKDEFNSLTPEKRMLLETLFLNYKKQQEKKEFSSASTQEKSEKIKMLEEKGNFFDIRLLEPHDYYKGFLELLTEIDHVDPIDIIQFTSYVVNIPSNHRQIWVVEDMRYNVIVGTVTLIIENNLFNKMSKYCRIEDLVVHEGLRKYGLGRTLVNHVLKIAREINCYKVTLNTGEKHTRFYENCGFQKEKMEMTIKVTPTSVFRLEHDLLNDPDPFDT